MIQRTTRLSFAAIAALLAISPAVRAETTTVAGVQQPTAVRAWNGIAVFSVQAAQAARTASR